MPNKAQFITLRGQHHFDPVTLADCADVDAKAVYDMLLRNPVTRYEAEKVLRALSLMTGSMYTLDSVDVVFKGE